MIVEYGRRIFYNLSDGVVCFLGSERQGTDDSVKETTPEEDYPEYNPNLYGFVRLGYGDRLNEIIRFKSGQVVDGQLIIEQWTEAELEQKRHSMSP